MKNSISGSWKNKPEEVRFPQFLFFLTCDFWQVASMISLCPKGLLFSFPNPCRVFLEAEEESSSSGMSGFDKDDSPKPGLAGQGD